MDYVGEGKGVMLEENSTETCIFAICEIDDQSSLMHEAGRSKLLLWDDPEGWGGEGGGRGVQDGGHMCTRG